MLWSIGRVRPCPQQKAQCQHDCIAVDRTALLQVLIAGGLANVHVKRLAYDLCKAVPLSDSDSGLVCDGIKASGAAWWPRGQEHA